MPILMISLICIGIALIALAAFKFKNEDLKDNANSDLDNVLQKIYDAIEEADTVINEMDDFSKAIFKELNNKYDEVVNLYSLTEDKNLKSNLDLDEDMILEEHTIKRVGKSKKQNDKAEQILNFHLKGMSESEIAKKMDIGRGEVKFCLNSQKVGNYE